MKKYTLSDETCRRSLLLQHFVGNHEVDKGHHSCCDICSHKCLCAQSCAYIPPHCETGGGDLTEENSESEVYAPVHYPTAEQLKEVERRLHALRCDKTRAGLSCMLARTLPLDFLPTFLPQLPLDFLPTLLPQC